MSSRHRDLDKIACCAPARSVAVDWERFLARGSGSSALPTPIDEFYEAQRSLVRLSRLVGDPSVDVDASTLLAGQVLLGYVSAAELYLRRSIARMVRLCPFVRRSNSSQTIPFGALDYCGASGVEHALTEQVSFTEPGKVKAQLESRLGVKVTRGTSLERSIDVFERLCQLRHALVHSHGVLSSTNASLLLGASGKSARRTSLDTASLESAAAVALNLVRDVNAELIRSTLWRWILEGYVASDRRTTRPRIASLIKTVGSQNDLELGEAKFDDKTVTEIVVAVVEALSSPST